MLLQDAFPDRQHGPGADVHSVGDLGGGLGAQALLRPVLQDRVVDHRHVIGVGDHMMLVGAVQELLEVSFG